MLSEINNTNKESPLSSEFETIFWKTVEWVEITNHKQIGDPDYRIKFKNIQSMKWMIVNKQYQLLKYKLKNCEKLIKSNSTIAHTDDNYIEINEHAMDFLLMLGTFDDVIGEMVLKNESKQQLVNERLILSDILPLILNNKKLEIANMNLIRMSIINNNITALQILLNEPYSYQMYPSDLEWSILNSSVSLVSYIIGLSNVIIYPSTRSKSIQLAYKNISHRNEMLKLILDNPQLYHSSSIQIDNYGEAKKKFKSEDGTPINIDATSKKLKTLSLFKIKSPEIQNKLLDLHLIKKIKVDSPYIKGLTPEKDIKIII